MFLTHPIRASCCGKARIEEAKITGITPPALTLSGMWVDWPPITRRPTTRLAYCTGMRRSPRSTRTMNATTAIIITISEISVSALHSRVTKTFCRYSAMAFGRPTTMPAKMISDMPLPMPRSVICSPSHMMKAVPVVSDRIVSMTKPKPGLMTMPCLHGHQALGDAEGLQHGKDDGQVAGPLGDLAPAQLAFLLQFFEGGNHHRQQLQNDRRRDVRHDAQREDRQPADVAAGEQVEEAEDRSRLRAEELLPALDVDSGRGDVAAQPVHRQHRQREQHPLAKIRNAKDVRERFKKPS